MAATEYITLSVISSVSVHLSLCILISQTCNSYTFIWRHSCTTKKQLIPVLRGEKWIEPQPSLCCRPSVSPCFVFCSALVSRPFVDRKSPGSSLINEILSLRCGGVSSAENNSEPSCTLEPWMGPHGSVRMFTTISYNDLRYEIKRTNDLNVMMKQNNEVYSGVDIFFAKSSLR